MKKLFLASSLLLGAVACAPVSTGGAGQTSSGQPLSGVVTMNNLQQEYKAEIISPAGWNCSSSFGATETPGRMTRTVPLTCSNGATGNLVLTGNQFQNQIVGTFQLSNGESGQVVFGRT